MKQTAVEWLVKKLIDSGVFLLSEEYEIIEQAIEIEKQQSYSEEEVLELLKKIQEQTPIDYNDEFMFAEEWFETYKK